MLEGQLHEVVEEVGQDKGAADLMRKWMQEGKIEVNEHNEPNIIGNRNEMSEPHEESMQ